jgi:hypothetical protein
VIGSWQQESVYVATACCEALVLSLIIKAPGPTARGVRMYLKAQVAIFFLLMPLSALSGCRFYFPAYAVASAVNLIAELGILAGIFVDLNVGVCVFGSMWLWFALCLAATVAIAAVLVLSPPSLFRTAIRFYLTLDQVGTAFRCMGLFAIVAYGWLCGTSWPPRISLIWLGMAIYSLMDFACQRLQLVQSFANHETVQYGPTAGSIVMLTLWAIALRTTSPLQFAATPEKQIL